MLELLTAFAKYVGAFINAALTKLRKDLDVKFKELTDDYNAKITDLDNKTSRIIHFKNSTDSVESVLESVVVDSNSNITATIEDKVLNLSTKRLMTIIEDSEGNKINIAESGIKIVPSEDITVSIDPISKELLLSTKSSSFVYESTAESIKHSITHNLDSNKLDISVLTKSLDGTYTIAYTGITIEDTNKLTVWLTDSSDLLCIIKKV